MSPSARTAAPRLALALLLAPLAACAHDDARESDSFAWSQSVAPGSWVRVRNTNGAIRVARAAGSAVRITATKQYKGRRPEPVRFLTRQDGSGAVVCAVWGSSGGHCSADQYGSGQRGSGSFLHRLLFRRSGVSVDFVVALPPGVRLDVSTVNGRVTVADAASEVRAKTVNGSVTVDARGGPVSAETVNGSVLARIADLAPGAGLSLGSVNGSVTALVPPALDGDLDLRTTNGRVVNELPVSAQHADRRSLRGILGAGGRRLSLQTVNGSVRFERAGAAGAPLPAAAPGGTM
jgi:hypothetical protein